MLEETTWRAWALIALDGARISFDHFGAAFLLCRSSWCYSGSSFFSLAVAYAGRHAQTLTEPKW